MTAESSMADSVAQWLAESLMADSLVLVLQWADSVAVLVHVALVLVLGDVEELVLFAALSARFADCSAALAVAKVADAVKQLLLAVATS